MALMADVREEEHCRLFMDIWCRPPNWILSRCCAIKSSAHTTGRSASHSSIYAASRATFHYICLHVAQWGLATLALYLRPRRRLSAALLMPSAFSSSLHCAHLLRLPARRRGARPRWILMRRAGRAERWRLSETGHARALSSPIRLQCLYSRLLASAHLRQSSSSCTAARAYIFAIISHSYRCRRHSVILIAMLNYWFWFSRRRWKLHRR